MQKNMFITGGTGFVGGALLLKLVESGVGALATFRRTNVDLPQGVQPVVFDLSETCGSLSATLSTVHVVIHIAARAHVMDEQSADAMAEYRKANVEGTINLARQAAAAGVQRFIFISSIGVNGNNNLTPFTEIDNPAPAENYALSKWEAEQALVALAKETGMEVVIIRPPLVYGANAPGNFGSLCRWVEKGVPLPLGVINNKKTFVALDNLISLIITCIDHPAAANEVFLAGDAEDLSTSDLLRRVAKAMNKPSRLIPVPQSWLTLAATVLGKKAVAQRLFGSLQVDISKARNLLGWEPPISVDEGLRRCFVKNQTTQ